MSLAAYAGEDRPTRKPKPSGQGKHHWHGRRPPAPGVTLASHSPANQAATAIWPWPVATYPGRLKGLAKLFHGRAAYYTIRDWRRGRRRLPQWANELLTVALKQRRDEINHALALLAKEKSPD